MNTLKMVLRMLSVGILAFAALLNQGCAGEMEKYSSYEEVKAAQLGGSTLVYHYVGLTDIPGSKPAVWTAKQYGELQELRAGCWKQIMPQIAGTRWKSGAKEGAEYMAGQAAGMTLGILPFHPGNFLLKYTAEGAANGAATGGIYGGDLHRQAVNLDEADCLYQQIYWAQEQDGALIGVGVGVNYDSVNTSNVPVPSGPEANSTGRVNSGIRPPLPPGH